MIILGIDPGTNFTGFGIVQLAKNQFQHIQSGYIEFPKGESLFQKLKHIYSNIFDLITNYGPQALAVENVFVHQNIQSALKLGHARAAAILAGLHHQLPIAEYTPREMKLAVTGRGNASKEQVKFMVKQILNLTDKISLDQSDALGLAICHANRVRSPRSSMRSWSEFLKHHPELIKKN